MGTCKAVRGGRQRLNRRQPLQRGAANCRSVRAHRCADPWHSSSQRVQDMGAALAVRACAPASAAPGTGAGIVCRGWALRLLRHERAQQAKRMARFLYRAAKSASRGPHILPVPPAPGKTQAAQGPARRPTQGIERWTGRLCGAGSTRQDTLAQGWRRPALLCNKRGRAAGPYFLEDHGLAQRPPRKRARMQKHAPSSTSAM